MEDGQLPITIGQGAGAQVVTLDLPPFTLVGATTRAGLLTTPLRDRFGIQHRLDPYDAGRPRARSSCAPRASSARRSRARAPARSPSAPAAPRASPTACSSASATSPRSAATGVDRRRRRRRRARAARDRPRGPGPPRPRAAAERLHVLRRRPRRALDARRRGRRGGGHDRGRLRAVPAPARLPAAHAAGPLRHRRAPTRTSGLEPPADGDALLRPSLSAAVARPATLPGDAMAHLFICPNCGNRTTATERTAGFRREARGCSKCGFAFLFELLDDYYPAPERRVLRLRPAGSRDRLRPGLLRAHRPRRRARHRPLGLRRPRAPVRRRHRPRQHRPRVGRPRARQARAGPRRGRPAREGDRRPLPRLRRRRGSAAHTDPVSK